MTTHHLKSWPEFFQPIATGAHKFTLRKNDRKFKIGDTIEFLEWAPDSDAEGGGTYTGRGCKCRVTSMIEGTGTGGIEALRGLAAGFVILALGEHMGI